MQVEICSDKKSLGARAAAAAADAIKRALVDRGEANIIVATGASQFDTIASLVQVPGIRWDRVTAFHLDEYVGMPITHPASFRAYLWKRFVSKLDLPLAAFHYVEADRDPHAECERLSTLIRSKPIDVALVGIGENGHLAFNDPPADFETEAAYLVVNLDEACRRQQMGEGWFKTLGDVPQQAISMSIRQIMKSKIILASVPDARKAAAAKASIEGPVSPTAPASIMQRHKATTIYLDPASAQQLRKQA
jgi:glucosamine-6-phosphate deaminase